MREGRATCGGEIRLKLVQHQFASSLRQLLPVKATCRRREPDRPRCDRAEDQPPSEKKKVPVRIGGCQCVWRDVPGQEITSADGAVSHVAGLTGAQVSSDGVGADGVLVT